MESGLHGLESEADARFEAEGGGKRSLTESTAWFLAAWVKRLSWNEVARVFRTPWDQVFSSVEMAVSWGREH